MRSKCVQQSEPLGSLQRCIKGRVAPPPLVGREGRKGVKDRRTGYVTKTPQVSRQITASAARINIT